MAGLLIATAVIASKPKTNTNTDPEAPYKELTYMPEPTYPSEPFPVGTSVPKLVDTSEEDAFLWIVSKEGWLTSVNDDTFACGMPQANPCDKLIDYAGVYHELPVDRLHYTEEQVVEMLKQIPYETQAGWMWEYIHSRYTTAVNAKAFWEANGWY